MQDKRGSRYKGAKGLPCVMAAHKAHVEGFGQFLLSERGVSMGTLANYMQDVMPFLEWLGKQHITASVMQAYAKVLFDREYSKRTMARKCSSIRMYCLYLYKQGLLEEQPRVLLPVSKQGLYLPKVLDEGAIEQLLSALPQDGAINQRNAVLVELLYGCGLRISECVRLDVSDLRSDAVLRILGKGQKRRLVPIPEALFQNVTEYVKNTRSKQAKSKALFLTRQHKRFHRASLHKELKALFYACGFDITAHMLRHSYATHLLNRGMGLRDVQVLLGHSSIETTQIYTHVSQNQLQEALETYHPRWDLRLS